MDFNSREHQILELIFNSDVPVHVNEITEQLNISKRSVQYDIKKINNYLELKGLKSVQSIYGLGYLIDHTQKKQLASIVKFNNNHQNYYQFLPHERVNIMMAYISSKMGFENLDSFETICQVSRNTVISDLKLVREIFSDYNIRLDFIKNQGYKISSNPIQSRSLFLYYFDQVRYLYKRDVLRFIEKEVVDAYLLILQKIEDELNTVYVEGVLESLAALLSLIPNINFDKSVFTDIDINQIKQKNEYLLVEKYLHDFPDFEKIYISLHLLGGRVQLSNEIIQLEHEEQQLYDLCRYMVFDFESVACIKFNDSNEIVQALFVHLRSSIYRYKYGIDIGNPLTETIKKKYKYLFEITKLVSADIRKFFGMPASENEIAYLTIIFGSKMEKSKFTRDSTVVHVICFESLGIREMLKNELEFMVEDSEVFFLESVDEVNKLNNQDILLSIHPLDIEFDYILINPVLTTMDKQNIMNRIFKFSMKQNHNMLMESIFDMMKKYVNPQDKDIIYKRLGDIFKKYTMVDYALEQQNPSLIDILQKEHINIFEGDYIWNQSLEIAAKPLLKEGIITQNYIDTILEIIIKRGPYMYFGKGVFIAHATPKDGVNRLGVSLSFFKKPVVFDKDKLVQIIIYLAPIDYHKHLRIIKEILELFDVEESFDEFLKLKSPNIILEKIENKIRKKV